MMPSPEMRPWVPRGSVDYLRYCDYDSSPVHRNRLVSVVDMIAEHAHGRQIRIVEIGCGTGSISVPLGSLGHLIDATDIDAASLEIARQRNTFANVHFHAPGSELDLSNYDVILMTEVLEHVREYREMFAQIAAKMRTRSRLILTLPNGWSPIEIACRPSYFLNRYAAGHRVVQTIKSALGTPNLTTANEQTPHLHFFTLPALKRLFLENGLRVMQMHGFFFAWPLAENFLPRFPSEKSAESDFVFSQKLPMAGRAMWFFSLMKGDPSVVVEGDGGVQPGV